jgi:hypothetical protein
MIKSRRVIWAGHVARIEKIRIEWKNLVGKHKSQNLGDLGANAMIIRNVITKI